MGTGVPVVLPVGQARGVSRDRLVARTTYLEIKYGKDFEIYIILMQAKKTAIEQLTLDMSNTDISMYPFIIKDTFWTNFLFLFTFQFLLFKAT